MTIAYDRAGVTVATPDGPRVLLADVTATLTEPRIAVVGANGSGKSTLLRLVNGLVATTSGRVLANGLDPASNPKAVRAQVGFVFTDPLAQLVMPTPVEDIELSLRRRLPHRGERRERALGLLRERGLEALAHQSVYDLSGGERQLVALASVLAVEPTILVLDEPTTLLDLRHAMRLRDLLRALPQQVLYATHDLALAADADRVLVIDQGRLVADGAPREAIAHYVALMGG